MTIGELEQLIADLKTYNYATNDTKVTVSGVGPGLPLDLTGDFSKAPRGEDEPEPPVLLHSQAAEC